MNKKLLSQVLEDHEVKYALKKCARPYGLTRKILPENGDISFGGKRLCTH